MRFFTITHTLQEKNNRGGKKKQKTKQEKQSKPSYHYLLSGEMKQLPNWFLCFCPCLLLPFVSHTAVGEIFLKCKSDIASSTKNCQLLPITLKFQVLPQPKQTLQWHDLATAFLTNFISYCFFPKLSQSQVQWPSYYSSNMPTMLLLRSLYIYFSLYLQHSSKIYSFVLFHPFIQVKQYVLREAIPNSPMKNSPTVNSLYLLLYFIFLYGTYK